MQLPDPSRFVGYIMEVHCPSCDGLIGMDHQRHELVQIQSLSVPRRRITAYCEHCNVAWFAELTLADGLWHIDGQVTRLTAAASARFQRSLARKSA